MIETAHGPAPVVILEDKSSRIMPIYIGLSEALSIHSAITHEVPPRPMTHDLFISLLERMHSKIESILIDELNDGVYFARLNIVSDTGHFELDARPSDCIALALRAASSVFVRGTVFDQAVINKEDLKGALGISSYL